MSEPPNDPIDGSSRPNANGSTSPEPSTSTSASGYSYVPFATDDDSGSDSAGGYLPFPYDVDMPSSASTREVPYARDEQAPSDGGYLPFPYDVNVPSSSSGAREVPFARDEDADPGSGGYASSSYDLDPPASSSGGYVPPPGAPAYGSERAGAGAYAAGTTLREDPEHELGESHAEAYHRAVREPYVRTSSDAGSERDERGYDDEPVYTNAQGAIYAGAAAGAAQGAGSAHRSSREWDPSPGAGRYVDDEEAAPVPASRSRATESQAAPAKPRKSVGKRIRRFFFWSLVILGVLGVLGMIGIGVAYAATTVPEPNDIAKAEASVLYYSDGKTELARLADPQGNRQSVTIDQIPKVTQDAMVAAEDRTFYTNGGISIRGIIRALAVAARGTGETQGGSTITQQYVKNYFLTQDQTYSRKVKEIFIALKIDRSQSKDEILANYFNTIYYGRGASGIQMAARAYFGKDVGDLNVSESAFLASVIRGPSLYDPSLGETQEKNAKERWNYVLDGMVDMGTLTQAERDQQKFPTFKSYKPPSLGGPNGYVINEIKRELKNKYKLSDSDLDQGGLRVTTTIDKAKQKAAIASVKETLPAISPPLRTGLVSIKPGDGAVVALYGGKDFAKQQYNDATDSTMQAGSTFKIFTLIAALEAQKVSLNSTFSGASPQYFPEFANPNAEDEFNRRGGVKNDEGHSSPNMDLVRATAYSVNTIYAQLNILATPEATKDVAVRAGVPEKRVTTYYNNVLGTDSVSVKDMATAYATIASGGIYAQPYYVSSIAYADPDLKPTKAKPVTKRVFDEAIIADVTKAMQAVVTAPNATGTGAALPGRPVAGKTGTTDKFKSAWFDGFTPQLATAVGVFRPNPDESATDKNLSMTGIPGWGSGQIFGGTIPASIWQRYMSQALEGAEVIQFPQAANVNPDAKPAAPKRQQPKNTPNRPTNVPKTPKPKPTPTPPPPTDTPPPPTPTPTPTDTPPPPTPTPKPTPTATPPVEGT